MTSRLAAETKSGRRDLNPRPLDPQILAPAREPQRMPRSVRVQQSPEVRRDPPGCVPVAVPGCCTASAQTRTVRPGAGSQFGRSVARSGPHQRERRCWPSAVEGRGVADRWSLSRMARLPAASFDNREAFGPFVFGECVQGELEAIRFVAESGQRPGRLDSGLGSGIAGADAQKFRIITSLLVAPWASVIVEVLDTFGPKGVRDMPEQEDVCDRQLLPLHRPSGNHERRHGQRASHISLTRPA